MSNARGGAEAGANALNTGEERCSVTVIRVIKARSFIFLNPAAPVFSLWSCLIASIRVLLKCIPGTCYIFEVLDVVVAGIHGRYSTCTPITDHH